MEQTPMPMIVVLPVSCTRKKSKLRVHRRQTSVGVPFAKVSNAVAFLFSCLFRYFVVCLCLLMNFFVEASKVVTFCSGMPLVKSETPVPFVVVYSLWYSETSRHIQMVFSLWRSQTRGILHSSGAV